MAKVTLKRDGLTLVGEREEPFGESYDLAILFHGLLVDRNTPLLRQLADQLRDENVASVRFDFNGHGESDGKLEDMTVLNELADANAILTYVRTDPHVRNIYLVGHSQGGLIASLLAGLYPDKIKKIVLLAPAATLKTDALEGHTLNVVYNPDRIPDKIRVGQETIGGFYLRTAQRLPVYEIAQQFTGRVCLIHGTNDQAVALSASQKYNDVYANSELHLVAGADHNFSDGFSYQAVKLAANFLKPIF